MACKQLIIYDTNRNFTVAKTIFTECYYCFDKSENTAKKLLPSYA